MSTSIASGVPRDGIHGRCCKKAYHPRLSLGVKQDMKDTSITIRKSGGVDRWVLFLLSGSVFLPGAGVLVLWSAVVADSWWIMLLSITAGLFLVSAGVLFLHWGITAFTPAQAVIENGRVQHFVRDRLRQVIELDERASLTPSFNHFLGRSGFYGFTIASGKVRISLSPEGGWPLDDLHSSVGPVLRLCRERGCTISPLWEEFTNIADE